MWEHNFPEAIEVDAFAAMTDPTALAAYMSAIELAITERLGDDQGEKLSMEDATEVANFHASWKYAEVRVAEITAAAALAEADRKAKLSGIGFKKAAAPPPAPPAHGGAGLPVAGDGADLGDFTVQPKTRAKLDVHTFKEGEILTNPVDQSRALFERAKRLMGSNTGEKFGVLQVYDYIPDALKMPESGMAQFDFLNRDAWDDKGLVAGFCAPPTVDLTFCGGSPNTRPVLGSMRRYQAPTGRVTRIKTPLFNAVGTGANQVDTTGLGTWTNADDDADPFVNKVCSIMTCPTDEDFELHAIYKCIVIKNFMQLAFPSWVAWYLGQLDAHWARQAEVALLNEMWVRAGSPITSTPTYGALPSLVSRINELMGMYVENERYDDAGLVAWIPRWVGRLIQSDAIRQGKTISRGQIESALRDVGIQRVTWTMDNPDIYDDVQLQAKGTPLEDFPANAWVLLTKADNLRVMDIGGRDIGVTTEKVYRDTSTNLANNFQIFVEGFEAIIDMGCPVWGFEMPLCGNGLIAPTAGYDPQPCDFTGTPTPITGA